MVQGNMSISFIIAYVYDIALNPFHELSSQKLHIHKPNLPYFPYNHFPFHTDDAQFGCLYSQLEKI